MRHIFTPTMRNQFFGAPLGLIGCLLLGAQPVTAAPFKEKTELKIVGGTHFQVYKEKKQKYVEDNDISAATCLTSGICFAASDETSFLQQFSISGDEIEIGKRLRLTPLASNNEKLEFDLEALASRGMTIVAVGSHSWKRKKCRPDDLRQVVFIGEVKPALIGTTTPIETTQVSLIKAFEKFPDLRRAFDQPLQQNGLNIEGATILDQTVYFGFRAPSSFGPNNKALVLAVPLDDLLEQNFQKADLHRVNIGGKPGTGIRALETFGKQIVIVAGNSGVAKAKSPKRVRCAKESAHRNNPFMLHLWDPAHNTTKEIGEIKLPDGQSDGKSRKAEGIILLDTPVGPDGSPQEISLVVFFDGGKSGQPTRFTFELPP